MLRTPSSPIVIMAVSLAVLGSMALAAQDKYTLKVPNGLAFSEFRGYEWMGLRPVSLRLRVRYVYAKWERR